MESARRLRSSKECKLCCVTDAMNRLKQARGSMLDDGGGSALVRDCSGLDMPAEGAGRAPSGVPPPLLQPVQHQALELEDDEVGAPSGVPPTSGTMITTRGGAPSGAGQGGEVTQARSPPLDPPITFNVR